MTRTIILSAAVVVIAIGVVIAGIFLFRYVTQPGAVLGPRPSPSPAPLKEAFTAISSGNVTGPTKDVSGARIRYLDSTDGKLKEIDFEGAVPRLISDEEFQNVFRVNWSPVSNKILLEYMAEFEHEQLPVKQITYFDPATGTTTPLNLSHNIRELSWSPDGSQIAYHWRDDFSGENAIYVSAPDTSNRRSILPIQLFAVKLFWLDSDRLLIAEKPAPGIQPLIILRNLRDNTTRLILENRFGAEVLPSPDGNKILVSSTPDAVGTWLIAEVFGTDGKILATLPFATLAAKCAWGSDSETLFCAVPTFSSTDGLPFSYWTGGISSRDSFVAYKFTTDELRQLAKTPLSVDAVELVIPSTEDAIAFINRLDGRLTVFKP